MKNIEMTIVRGGKKNKESDQKKHKTKPEFIIQKIKSEFWQLNCLNSH